MIAKTVERIGSRNFPWRWLSWGGVAVLLALPLIFDAPWSLFDYLTVGFALCAAALLVEVGLRLSSDAFFRLGACIAIGTGLLLAWVNGAVGFLGDENNPANLMFFLVHGTALLTAIDGQFRAAALERAMRLAALVQLVVGAIGYFGGFAEPGSRGIYEVVLGTSLFCGLWLTAAALFRHAARRLERLP